MDLKVIYFKSSRIKIWLELYLVVVVVMVGVVMMIVSVMIRVRELDCTTFQDIVCLFINNYIAFIFFESCSSSSNIG